MLSRLEPTINLKKRGIVIVDANALFAMDDDIRQEVFKNLVIVEVVNHYFNSTIEYRCYSEKFEEVLHEGVVTPRYIVESRRLQNGKIEVEFKKC